MTLDCGWHKRAAPGSFSSLFPRVTEQEISTRVENEMTRAMFLRWDCFSLLMLSLFMTGCPPQPEKSAPPAKPDMNTTSPADTTETPSAAAEETTDDPAAVKVLQDMKVNLKKNDAGQVVSADCKFAGISDKDLDLFKKLPNLKTLSLENSQVTNDGLKFLEFVPQLQDLGLRRCTEIDDAGLAALKFLPHLQRLGLLYTRTTNAGLEHVAPLHDLKVLDLRGCTQISDAGLVHLEGLTNLVDLKLRTYSVTDAGMKSLGKLHKLRVLSLEDCSVGDAGMAELKSLKDLRSLNVMRTVVGDDGLANFAEMKLVDLSLRDTAVSGAGLDSLKASIPTLTHLNLSETRIDNDGVAHIAPFTKLQDLNLWNASLDDEGLKVLAGLTDLRDLNLEACRTITSASADQLVKFPQLVSLNLVETGLDNDGLKKLGSLSHLKLLNVARSGVTEEAGREFQKAHPGCTVKY